MRDSFLTAYMNLFRMVAVAMIVLFIQLAIFGQTTQANNVRSFSANKIVEDEIAGGQTHRYQVELAAGEFLKVILEQKGIDVVIKFWNKGGKMLAEMDSPNLSEGYEVLSWVTEQASTYEIEIVPFDKQAKKGRYSLQRIDPRTATLQDRQRVENEKLFMEAIALHSASEESERAKILPLLDKVLTEYIKQNDPYLIGLTKRQIIFVSVAQNESLNQKDMSVFNNSTKEELQGERAASEVARRVFEKLKAKRYEAITLLHLGYICSLLGEQEVALRSYDLALSHLESIFHKRGVAICYLAMARTWYFLGEEQKALSYLIRANDIFKSVGDKAGEALTILNLGFIYENLGDYKKALDHYSLAAQKAREADDRITYDDAFAAIASFQIMAGGYQSAIDMFLKLLESRRKTDDIRGVSNILNQLGFAYDKANQKENALEYYLQSVFISKAIGDKQGEAITLNNLMFLFESLKQPRLAVFAGKQATNIYQELRASIHGLNSETQRKFVGSIEGTYQKLADILISEGRIAEAERVLAMLKEEEYFDFIRRDDKVADELKSRVSLTPDEQKAFDDYKKYADKITVLAKEYGDLQAESKRYEAGKYPKQKRLDELEKLVAGANKVFNAFLDDLKVKFGESGKNDLRVANLESGSKTILKELGLPRTVMISTIASEERLNLIVTTSDTQRAHTVNIKVADLNKLVFEFRADVKNPRVDPRIAGKKLYDTLFPASLQKDLEGVKAETIVWSLDGTLRYVPVAALWDGKQYLVEKYKNVLITLASRGRLANTSQDRTKWQALGVGVSKQATLKDSDGSSRSFEALTAVPEELCSVIADPEQKCSAFVNGKNGVIAGKSLLDDRFTLSSFKSNLGRYPVVHIASHFSLNPGNENDSYLLLGGGEVRKLTLADVRQGGANFLDVELLTLSACDTAMSTGNKSNGVEVESFGVIAQNQGARSVLASLWPVADNSTRDLMIEFYKQLEATPRISKAEALQKAQLSLLNGKYLMGEIPAWRKSAVKSFQPDAKAPFAHPNYWSPFILMGNWQ